MLPPSTMRAMVIHGTGVEACLVEEEVGTPQPSPRQVLVEVWSAAVNRADLSQLAGRYSQQATATTGPRIAGLEVAGIVVAVGQEVTRFGVGDRVMSQCAGGFADYVAIDERLPLHAPDSLSWPEAAATPVGIVTEYDALITNGRLTAGDTVLIQAAGSAVGMAAIQIAKLHGARVVGTVMGERQAAVCRDLGADLAIDVTRESAPPVIDAATAGAGVPLIVDHVGGPVLADNLAMLSIGGRLVSVGRLGPVVGDLDLDLLAKNRLTLIGVSFRTRTLDEYGQCVSAAAKALADDLQSGQLKPIVDGQFTFADAKVALERLAKNEHLGKIVLDVRS
jgi:NADPH2:quinone reductase